MSFPDPHHPWDPPASELGRVDWRDVPLPAGYPESAAERERILDAKPRHWRLWYDGTLVSNYEAPTEWVPATLTADQVREVNARNAVECELIDEALGRVLAAVAARGLGRRRRRRLHHRPRRAPGRLRAAVQGAVPRRRADAAAADLAAGAVGRRCAPAVGHAPRSGSSTSPRRSAAIAGLPAAPTGCRARRCPVDDADADAAGLRAGAHRVGQRAVRRRRCTCARSPATAGCAPPTGPAPCTTAPRASSTTSPTTRSSSVNRWDDPAGASDPRRPGRRPRGPPAPGPRPPAPPRGPRMTRPRRHCTQNGGMGS